MALSFKHTKTSAKADGVDATLIQPSDWNAEHTFTAAAGKVVGRDATGAGALQELPLSYDGVDTWTLLKLKISTLLDLTNITDALLIPKGTTAQRPGSPASGDIRFNTDTSKFEGYNGAAWTSLAGAGGGNITISDNAPGAPNSGDLWWSSSDGQLYIYYNDGNSSQWVVITAAAGAQALQTQFARINTTANLLPNMFYGMDSSPAPFTATLPATSLLSDGYSILCVDVGGSVETNNITLDGNGNNINFMGQGNAATLTWDGPNYSEIVLTWKATAGIWQGNGFD